MVHVARQLGDAERGRVRCENRVLPDSLVQESEQATFDIHRFRSRFDDELGALHGKSEVGASLDPAQNLISLRFGEFSGRDEPIEVFTDHLEPRIDGAEVNVVQDRIETGKHIRWRSRGPWSPHPGPSHAETVGSPAPHGDDPAGDSHDSTYGEVTDGGEGIGCVRAAHRGPQDVIDDQHCRTHLKCGGTPFGAS